MGIALIDLAKINADARKTIMRDRRLKRTKQGHWLIVQGDDAEIMFLKLRGISTACVTCGEKLPWRYIIVERAVGLSQRFPARYRVMIYRCFDVPDDILFAERLDSCLFRKLMWDSGPCHVGKSEASAYHRAWAAAEEWVKTHQP